MEGYKLRESIYVGCEKDLEEKIEIIRKMSMNVPNAQEKAHKASSLHKEL